MVIKTQICSIDPQKSLLLHLCHKSLLLCYPLPVPILFSGPIVLPFPECCINGIVKECTVMAFGSGFFL